MDIEFHYYMTYLIAARAGFDPDNAPCWPIPPSSSTTTTSYFDPFTDRYTWKSVPQHKQSHWYRFQEAIKTQQDQALKVLRGTNLKGLELRDW